MTDMATAILDAAERMIRAGGFHGFSFRDIAAEVGVKSSSVHYHFPTKEVLAAAVIRRWTDKLARFVQSELARGEEVASVFARAFRYTAHSKERMCPCVLLAPVAGDLPHDVAAELKRFFAWCMDTLCDAGLSRDRAAEVLATISGAMVIASALDDVRAYDRAAGALLGDGKAASRKAARTRAAPAK